MKPEFSVEGDKLKISVVESKDFDTDGDGESAIKASLSLNIEADGSEVMDELFKSSDLVKKAVEKLKELGVKI